MQKCSHVNTCVSAAEVPTFQREKQNVLVCLLVCTLIQFGYNSFLQLSISYFLTLKLYVLWAGQRNGFFFFFPFCLFLSRWLDRQTSIDIYFMYYCYLKCHGFHFCFHD